MTMEPTIRATARSTIGMIAIGIAIAFVAVVVITAALRFDEHKPMDVVMVPADMRCLPPGVRGTVMAIIPSRRLNPFTYGREAYVTVVTHDQTHYDCARAMPIAYHVGEHVVGAP